MRSQRGGRRIGRGHALSGGCPFRISVNPQSDRPALTYRPACAPNPPLWQSRRPYAMTVANRYAAVRQRLDDEGGQLSQDTRRLCIQYQSVHKIFVNASDKYGKDAWMELTGVGGHHDNSRSWRRPRTRPAPYQKQYLLNGQGALQSEQPLHCSQGFQCFSKISCCQDFPLFLSLASMHFPSSQYLKPPHSPGSALGAAAATGAMVSSAVSASAASKYRLYCMFVLRCSPKGARSEIRLMQRLCKMRACSPELDGM
jgi:hypothetical protein